MTFADFSSKGMAYKMTYMFEQMERHELAASTKTVVAVADGRDAADNLKQYMVDEIEAYDHIQSGKLQRSVGVRNLGGGEYGITMEEYGVYVNGYDREKEGVGFIDTAVQQATLDGDDVEVII